LLFGLTTTLKSQGNDYLLGQTKLTNPSGRTLLLERGNEDSWLTFHDPQDSWFSFGIDYSDGGKLKLNYGEYPGRYNHFTMDKDGKIGIGSKDPKGKFEILQNSQGANVNLLTLSNQSQDVNTEVTLRFSPTSDPDLRYAAISGLEEGGNQVALKFITGAGSIITEKMRITSSGKVGIGTTAPGSKLHIIRNGVIDGGITKDECGLVIESATDGSDATLRLITDNSNLKTAIQAQQTTTTVKLPLLLNPLGGNVGIGTTTPTSLLTVAGKIGSKEVKVSVDNGADFVFEENYPIKNIEEVEAFIKENKHLPEIASATEMKENGIELGSMNIKLLQKIEELTLYLIDQNKEVKRLKSEAGSWKTEVKNLKEEKTEVEVKVENLTELLKVQQTAIEELKKEINELKK